jgi:hypothetical protein
MIKVIVDPFKAKHPSKYCNKTPSHQNLLSLTFTILPVLFTLSVSAVHSIIVLQTTQIFEITMYTNVNTCCKYDGQTAAQQAALSTLSSCTVQV